MTKRLQNRIAESGTILFVSAFYIVLVWLLATEDFSSGWLQLCCFMLAAYLFRELNNSNSLIRIRTQLVSSIFLILTAACPILFDSISSSVIVLCLVIMFFFLFRTYQNPDDAWEMYYSFLFLSIASLMDVHILLLVPFIWLLCLIHLQSLGWRTWAASLLALLTPYWICSPWYIFQGDWQIGSRHFEPLFTIHPLFDYSHLSLNETCYLILVIILTIISIIDFLRRGYQDRIRIRQILSIFYTIFFLTTIFLLFRPDLHKLLLPIITVSASPLIAHFFALTHSKVTNFLFIVAMLCCLLITLIGLVPSFEEYGSQLINAPWIGL